MKLLNFSIIKLSLFLIIGICIGFYINITLLQISILLSVLIFGLAVVVLISKFKKTIAPLFDVFSLFCLVAIGVFSTVINNETLVDSHYTNHQVDYENNQNLKIKVLKRLKPNLYNDKFIAEVFELNSKKASGKLLFNIQKNEKVNNVSIDDVFFVSEKVTEVSKPKNPFQFDYNAYLKQRHIHHQITLSPKNLLQLESTTTTLQGYADSFRKKVNQRLKKAGFKDNVLSIINALLLGQRQDISLEIYNSYVNAGVIHILAVSGLHVGLLMLILSYILKPLHYFTFGRYYLKPLLIVLLLWAFAIITGLSPSVTRAVSMFSIITIGLHLKRPSNIYNTLAISAFFILLIKPEFLFDVGFQMSYLAVIGIVSFQPLIYKIWKPKYVLTDKLWQILTVTIAAQIGVFPLSLFYFHQFPSLFFVSNIIIIPCLGIILGFGILIIVLSLMEALPKSIVELYSFIIESLNHFIAWVAQFESFLLKDISFNIYYLISIYLISIYLIILSVFLLWKVKSYNNFVFVLINVVLFSVVMLYTKFENSANEFVIFNKSRHTILAQKQNHNVTVYHNLDSVDLIKDKVVSNYTMGNFVNRTAYNNLNDIYQYNTNYILVIDSLGVYNMNSIKPKYILLRNSPKINLNRLIDSLKPNQIIADASNYRSYVERWKLTCFNKKIPFHSTYEKGAFVIN